MSESPYSPPAGVSDNSPVSGRSQLVPVAIALLVVSILWIFFCLYGIAFFVFNVLSAEADPETRNSHVYFSAILAIELAYSCVLVTGGFSMIRRGSYTWAIVTNCLALVPVLSPFYFLGIPIGIWGLVTLRKAGVQGAFKKL